MMPGVTLKEVRDADAPQALKMPVAFLLHEDLDVITPSRDFGFRAFKLVAWADKNGRFPWRLIALDHHADPNNKGIDLRRFGDWNQRVPIGMIRDRLTLRNKAAALGRNGS
jgi:hypothetical protein